MPYVDQKSREEIYGEKVSRDPKTAGELNYVITMHLKPLVPIIRRYIAAKGEVRYHHFNEVFGAMFGAWVEFIRRALPGYGTYESVKIKEKGDVYDK
jgi:hypothetical protein